MYESIFRAISRTQPLIRYFRRAPLDHYSRMAKVKTEEKEEEDKLGNRGVRCHHRRRSDWNAGGRMAGLTIKVLL